MQDQDPTLAIARPATAVPLRLWGRDRNAIHDHVWTRRHPVEILVLSIVLRHRLPPFTRRHLVRIQHHVPLTPHSLCEPQDRIWTLIIPFFLDGSQRRGWHIGRSWSFQSVLAVVSECVGSRHVAPLSATVYQRSRTALTNVLMHGATSPGP